MSMLRAMMIFYTMIAFLLLLGGYMVLHKQPEAGGWIITAGILGFLFGDFKEFKGKKK